MVVVIIYAPLVDASKPSFHPQPALGTPLLAFEMSLMRRLRLSRFLSSPVTIRVPLFLLFAFNKGILRSKGQKVLLRNLVVVTCFKFT